MNTIANQLDALRNIGRDAAAALPFGFAYQLYCECAERLEAGRSVDCDAYRALLKAQQAAKAES